MLLNELFESTALRIIFSNLFESKKIICEGISHPEDLIISNGSAGAERVVKELLGLEKTSETVSIKWDGFPAVVFGRDANGKLVFVDKHMFDKVAKGKMEFTTIKDYDEERGANRSDLWAKEANLRKALEKIVPKVKDRFWMGDLLWTGTPEIVDNYYTFKPNTVEYQVKADSELGEDIGKSVGGIAVHTFIPGLGQTDIPLRGLEGLPEHADVVFLTGEIKDTKPRVAVDKKVVADTQKVIKQYGPAADKFIEALGAAKGKSILTAMGPFITSMLEQGDIKTDIIPRFLEFLKTKLSGPAATKFLGENKDGWLYKEGAPGLEAVWKLWATVTDLKINLKRQLDSQLEGSEVRALINGKDSHEGYVFGAGEEKLKIVDRLGFTAAHFGKFKVSPEEIEQKRKMPMAVFCFGRMNPPTIGHELVMKKTVELGGKNAYIFLSNSVKPDTDPLNPATKAAFISKIYPQFAKHIVKEGVLNPIYAANWLYDKGYRNMTFVAGSDRLGDSKGSIEKILTQWNSGPVRTTDNARGPKGREHVVLNFVSSGERDADVSSVTGVSGSLARAYAAEGNKQGFERATGVSDTIKVNGKTLYQAVREGMGIHDIVNNKPVAKAAKKPVAVAETLYRDNQMKITEITEDWDDEDEFDNPEDDLDNPEYMANMHVEEMQHGINDCEPDHFAENYCSAEDYIGEKDLIKDLARYISPANESKDLLLTLLLGTIKYEVDTSEVPHAAVGLFKAIKKNNVNWPELKVIERSLKGLLKEDWDNDWDNDYGQSEYLHALLAALDAGDADGVEYYYQTVLDEITETSLIRAIANHIDPENESVKAHLMKLLLTIMKQGEDIGVVTGLIEAIRWHVDWPELAVIERSLKADVKENDGDDDYDIKMMLLDLCDSIEDGNLDSFDENYDILSNWLPFNKIVSEIAGRIDVKTPGKKEHLIKFLLKAIKHGRIESDFISGLIAAIRSNNVNWPELAVIERSLKAGINEDKIKGVDGKACWPGYRYAGTVKGKDRCVKVKKTKK